MGVLLGLFDRMTGAVPVQVILVAQIESPPAPAVVIVSRDSTNHSCSVEWGLWFCINMGFGLSLL